MRVDVVPERYLTVAIADVLGDVAGRRTLLARADAASPDLRDALLARGALVDEVAAYRTLEGPAASRDRLRAAVRDGVDAILFTSGSTVRGLVTLLPRHLRRRATTIPALCIGPVTARTATVAGFRVAAIAAEHTAAGLAAATAAYFGDNA
jgi:uroporphyrinogen-III synthase